ncbi:LuxR C-terminal-related transcriptional regulator [Embleya sp. NPDC055664]
MSRPCIEGPPGRRGHAHPPPRARRPAGGTLPRPPAGSSAPRGCPFHAAPTETDPRSLGGAADARCGAADRDHLAGEGPAPHRARAVAAEPTSNPHDPQDAREPAEGRWLTKREIEVLTLVGHGLSNREIADRPYMGVTTVKSHPATMMSKTGTNNRVRLTVPPTRMGLLAHRHQPRRGMKRRSGRSPRVGRQCLAVACRLEVLGARCAWVPHAGTSAVRSRIRRFRSFAARFGTGFPLHVAIARIPSWR